MRVLRFCEFVSVWGLGNLKLDRNMNPLVTGFHIQVTPVGSKIYGCLMRNASDIFSLIRLVTKCGRGIFTRILMNYDNFSRIMFILVMLHPSKLIKSCPDKFI